METGKSEGLNDREKLPVYPEDESLTCWGYNPLGDETLIELFEALFPDAMHSAREELGEPTQPRRRRRTDSGT